MSATADIYDEYEARGVGPASCAVQFRDLGGRLEFGGPIETVRVRDENAIVKEVLRGRGHGRVLVIDGEASLSSALLGDNMARYAARNGWAGVIVHGAVRDAQRLADIDIGIKALGTNPRRSAKNGGGSRGEPVGFGGVEFVPGAYLVADPDGILVLPVHDNSSPEKE